MVQSYKDLKVWQVGVDFSVEIYKITKSFPREEAYGLTSQIRRAAVSVPANIAEGQKRGHTVEYIRFLRIAYGSGAELETHLLIAKKVGFLREAEYQRSSKTLDEIMSMLAGLIKSLQAHPQAS